MVSLLPILARGNGAEGLVLVLLAFLGFLTFAVVLRSQTQERVASLAGRLGGTAHPGGFLELPDIRLRVQNHSARIQFSGGKSPLTNLLVYLPEFKAGRFSIAQDSLGSQFLRLFGARDIRIGDPSFDDHYVVQAAPEALAHQVFAPARRRDVIAAVRRLFARVGLRIKAEPGRLEIEVRESVDDEAGLRGMLHSASDLVAALLAPDSQGVVLDEFFEESGGVCPVCCTRLTEPLVRCGRCRAPHHRECWEYLGRCAVYGCEPKPGRRAA